MSQDTTNTSEFGEAANEFRLALIEETRFCKKLGIQLSRAIVSSYLFYELCAKSLVDDFSERPARYFGVPLTVDDSTGCMFRFVRTDSAY